MKMILSLFCCFVFCAGSGISSSELSLEELANKLHVCTVANKGHPNLDKLITSCENNGITLEVVGMGEPYRNNLDKLHQMKKYCRQLADDDLILFVDAFDVIILADKQDIVSRFLAHDVSMLMSMELNCWPSPDTAVFHPETDSPFKYINSGGYIGYVSAIREWLDAFDASILVGRSDQHATHKLYARNPNFYALDHWCTIFLSLYKVPAQAVLIDQENRQIHLTYTNSSPCVLHANGRSFSIWDKVYSAFFMPL